jgi:zinc transport system substrate-binding protein
MAFLIGVAAVSLVGLQGCSSAKAPWEGLGGPPRVVVSFPPLYSFVKQAGGSHVGVISLCTETGPHHYVTTAQDALAVREADLLVGIGLGLDEKFLDVARSNSGQSKLKYVKLADSKRFDKSKDIKKLEGEDDPHVWLGTDTAKKLVMAIADELKAVDGQNAAEYQKNAVAYCEKLDDLRKEYRAKLKDKKDRKILPMHDSLQYFAAKDSFDLDIEEAIELKPGDKPDARRYQELLEKCADAKEPDPKKRKPIRIIATEPQYEEKEAETLKAELKKKKIDAVLIKIDPLETADANELKKLGGDWYETKMRENLDRLVENLK